MIRNQQINTYASVDDCFHYHLYRIAEAPLGHEDVASHSDKIKLKWFKPVTRENYAGDTEKMKNLLTDQF